MRSDRRLTFLCIVPWLGLAPLAGCSNDASPSDGSVDVFSAAEFTKVKTFGPLGAPPADSTNKYADSAAAAAFGQRLFYEKAYAGALTVGNDGTNGALGAVGDKGKVACASCHDGSNWYIDTRSKPGNVSLGVKYTARNAPSLVNASYYKWNSWSGKEDSQWYQGANGCESGANFGGNRLSYAHVVYAKYKADYNALFPTPLDAALDPAAADAARFPPAGKPKAAMTDPDGPWETMAAADQTIVNTIMANCGKALAAYDRKIVSRNAPIDKYIGGDYTALSAAAKRGLKLFIGKAACDGCHSGSTFTDQDFHVTGVAQMVGPNVPMTDNGRFDDVPKTLGNTWNGAGAFSDDQAAGAAKLAGLAQVDAQKGQFRTKSLRHVATTAPYFHNGSMATLEDVVAFYNMGGAASGFAGTKDPKMVPLNLTAAEQADLVAFLKEGLQGEAVPAQYGMDTSAP